MVRSVLTIGTFDCLHYGHIRLLARAARFGNLTVGINTDAFVASYKGRPPKYDLPIRLATVRALGYDAVRSVGPGAELIYTIVPDFLVVGSDWHEWDYLDQIDMTQKELDELGVTVVYLPRTSGVSTSV